MITLCFGSETDWDSLITNCLHSGKLCSNANVAQAEAAVEMN